MSPLTPMLFKTLVAPTEELFIKGDELVAQDDTHNTATIGITKEQYGQLENLLQHLHNNNGGESSNTRLTSRVANFAGILICSSSFWLWKIFL